MQAMELLHRMQTDPPAAAARAHGAHPQSVALPLGHVRQPAIRRQLQAGGEGEGGGAGEWVGDRPAPTRQLDEERVQGLQSDGRRGVCGMQRGHASLALFSATSRSPMRSF